MFFTCSHCIISNTIYLRNLRTLLKYNIGTFVTVKFQEVEITVGIGVNQLTDNHLDQRRDFQATQPHQRFGMSG